MPDKKEFIEAYINMFQMLAYIDKERYLKSVYLRLNGLAEMPIITKEHIQTIFVFDDFTKKEVDSIIHDIASWEEIAKLAKNYHNLHWLVSVVPELIIANMFVSRIKNIKVIKKKSHLIYDLH